jgi:hypothetical protein
MARARSAFCSRKDNVAREERDDAMHQKKPDSRHISSQKIRNHWGNACAAAAGGGARSSLKSKWCLRMVACVRSGVVDGMSPSGMMIQQNARDGGAFRRAA